jgi:hypothetical protein
MTRTGNWFLTINRRRIVGPTHSRALPIAFLVATACRRELAPAITKDVRRNLFVALLLLTCLSLTGGCKQQARNEPAIEKGASSGNDQKGYLHSEVESAMFLQWTEINGKLNGQMNVFYAKGSRGKSTETSSHSFEGVTNGKSISLNFTGSQWTDGLGGKTWTGTISGGEVTLIIPIKAGTLAPVKFGPGTVEQYNQAVLGIRQNVQGENTKVLKENAVVARIETEKNAVTEGNNRVLSLMNVLVNSTSQLERSLRFDDAFNAYAKSWEKMKADHRNLQAKAAETPLTGYKLGNVQYLLGGLQYDVGIFESHSGTVDYKLARVNDGITSVREAQKRLRASWEFLQQAVLSNSSRSPTAQFSEADLAQPLRESEEKIQKALAAIQQATKQRSLYNGQAKDLYKKAEIFVKSLKAVD